MWTQDITRRIAIMFFIHQDFPVLRSPPCCYTRETNMR
jgi:hypothetical protein